MNPESASPSLGDSTYEVRVRFPDTDATGFVHHARFLSYFEAARVEYLRRRGVSYRDFMGRGLHLPLSEATMRLAHPARFDDKLRVQVCLVEMAGATLVFSYRVTCQKEGGRSASGGADCSDSEAPVLIAEASTTHVCIDDGGRPRRLPKDITLALTRPEAPGLSDA